MPDVARARRETIRYHSALYRRSRGTAASRWPGQPQRLVVEALALILRPVHAYDLGAGTGRHSILMATQLPAGSRVAP